MMVSTAGRAQASCCEASSSASEPARRLRGFSLRLPSRLTRCGRGFLFALGLGLAVDLGVGLGLGASSSRLLDLLDRSPRRRRCGHGLRSLDLGRALGVDRLRRLRSRRAPPRRSPSAARRRGRPCRRDRAGSRAWRGGRRRGRRPRAARSSASAAGSVRSTPTPKDCLRTVKVSRTPLPWRLITTPSKTWVRVRLPSMTWKWTRTRSPAANRGPGLQLLLLEALDDRAHVIWAPARLAAAGSGSRSAASCTATTDSRPRGGRE